MNWPTRVTMEGSSDRQGQIWPAIVFGLAVAGSVSFPLYLWVRSPEVIIASFLITGYTAFLWNASRDAREMDEALRDSLRHLPGNRAWRRFGRLVVMPGFWWSAGFGAATVSGSVWYAGLHDPMVVAGVTGVWVMTAASMNFGATLWQPTSRCRTCHYELRGHVNPRTPPKRIRCPECGRSWKTKDLGIGITSAPGQAGSIQPATPPAALRRAG